MLGKCQVWTHIPPEVSVAQSSLLGYGTHCNIGLFIFRKVEVAIFGFIKQKLRRQTKQNKF